MGVSAIEPLGVEVNTSGQLFAPVQTHQPNCWEPLHLNPCLPALVVGNVAGLGCCVHKVCFACCMSATAHDACKSRHVAVLVSTAVHSWPQQCLQMVQGTLLARLLLTEVGMKKEQMDNHHQALNPHTIHLLSYWELRLIQASTQ
jgi:hypothetical protein